MIKLRKFRLNENPLSTSYTKNMNVMVDGVLRANNLKLHVKNGTGSMKPGPKGDTIQVIIPPITRGTGSEVRRAKVVGTPGATLELTASLYNASSGILATTGVEFEVTVLCNITGGDALNSAIPRLEADDDIFIIKSAFREGGTTVTKWNCVTNFQTTENCNCD